MGIPFTVPMGFLFTMTIGFLFTIALAIQLTISKGGLRCVVLGLEVLIIDRLHACKHWKSEIDCEMTEILIARYRDELDWAYLERKAGLPENDTLAELLSLRNKGR